MIEYPIPQATVVVEQEIKKSRFLTYLAHTEGVAQAKQFWAEIKSQHPNARHWCWACVAGAPSDSQQLGFSDDGEPSGTAGKPMLAALQGSGVGEISAVVVRYYGGILLGTGGLVRAYAGGVQEALKQLTTCQKVQRQRYSLICDYGQMNWLQQLFEQFEIVIEQQNFAENVHFVLGVRADKLTDFSQQLTERSAGQLALQKIE